MGRRKIEIEFIREDRSRATTFIKRKSGLFKKAHELAILTGAQVAVVVFSQQDRLFTYSNAPCSGICTRLLETSEPYETKGPQDYSANNDNEEDTDEEVTANAPSRKSSNAGHAKIDSSISTQIQNGSPSLSSRRGSAQTPEQVTSPREPAQSRQSTPRNTPRDSPPPSRQQKRGTSPMLDRTSEGSKYPRHEQGPREVSDVRSSPHQSFVMRSGSVISTPPITQASEFSSSHMAAPMVPPPQMYSQQGSLLGPQYIQHSQQPRQVQQQQEEHPAHQLSREQQQRHTGDSMQYQRVEYSSPKYEPPQSNARQLPMAPPLAIPTTVPSNSLITAGHTQQSTQLEPQRSVQPLFPLGATSTGSSRILLREQGEGNGLTPIESPSNFASTLYSSSGIAGIGTNISMPRISTDVGSLFYNWNTNEPGLSPATSMMLGQFREGDGAGSIPGASPAARSQMSGPPISAGVLENFSPTTAQWLSGHGISPPQASNGKPY